VLAINASGIEASLTVVEDSQIGSGKEVVVVLVSSQGNEAIQERESH
jgi:hypothetical protein